MTLTFLVPTQFSVIKTMESQVREKGQEKKKCENPKEKGREQTQEALETAKAGSELKMYFTKT